MYCGAVTTRMSERLLPGECRPHPYCHPQGLTEANGKEGLDYLREEVLPLDQSSNPCNVSPVVPGGFDSLVRHPAFYGLHVFSLRTAVGAPM